MQLHPSFLAFMARAGRSSGQRALNALNALTALTLLACLLAACTHSPRSIEAAQLAQDHLFVEPVESAAALADAQRLFEMSDAMRRFADRVSNDAGRGHDRRQALIDLLYRNDGLRLAYDAEATRTAAEAFEARAGNCLSLVLMTAAFAKHMDLPVSYQQVLVEDAFSRAGDLFFVSGHVNLVLGSHLANRQAVNAQWLTIDFLPQAELRGRRSVPLEERTLVAMYLNNRAAEALAGGRLTAAYWRARTALSRDPGFMAAANTLAVIYQRAGHAPAAERALRFVIEREPRSTTAWANLAQLLGAQGRHEEARQAVERLAALEPVPPFHHLEQGRAALAHGDAARARDLFLRELRLQPDQHEVHFWLAQAYAALGQRKPATHHLSQAAETSPTQQARAIYAGKLDRLRASQAQ